jgi:hypothetical protein
MHDIGFGKIAELQDLIGRLDQKASFLTASACLLIGLLFGGEGPVYFAAICFSIFVLGASIYAIWPRTSVVEMTFHGLPSPKLTNSK